MKTRLRTGHIAEARLNEEDGLYYPFLNGQPFPAAKPFKYKLRVLNSIDKALKSQLREQELDKEIKSHENITKVID